VIIEDIELLKSLFCILRLLSDYHQLISASISVAHILHFW